jgi:hypothetical protein
MADNERWEYGYIMGDSTDYNKVAGSSGGLGGIAAGMTTIEALNHWGAGGWDLVSTTPMGAQQLVWIFKKRKH